MKTIRLPPSLWKTLGPVAAEAGRLGVPLYLAGGCVRDLLLGARRGFHDLDLVAEEDPGPLARLCCGLIGAPGPSPSQFGTLRAAAAGLRVDFARSREESYAAPAALPEVRPAPLERDLGRRDFTVNAMALRLGDRPSGELIDPHGGARDLGAGLIRTLHPASFRDDPTRVFRMARYMARFRLQPAPGLRESAQAVLAEGHAARLSRHRLAAELWRILEEDDPSAPLNTLGTLGYLDLLRPGLAIPGSWPRGVVERLGALAFAQGGEGRPFLASLPVDRRAAAAVEEALRLAAAGASPRSRLEPAVLAILRRARPGLAPSALEPLFLAGADIARLGLEPGRRYGELLDEAARAQWAGNLRTRAGALAWLRRAARTP